MKHNCKFKDEEGEIYEPFLDSIISGVIEYDDFYDAYLWFGYKEKRFLFWKYGRGIVDILKHCPHCGEKIYEDDNWIKIK